MASNPTRARSPVAAESNKRARFDPTSLGLPAEFALTDYTRLKGCSCKLPQPKLLALLRDVATTPGRRDVGMDCSVVPLHRRDEKGKELFLVSTTDFFFPSVEDPFLQGQIGAANVLSDLYSLGISECDTMLMLLAASTDMDEQERHITTREIMRGFAERVGCAATRVTGGQTVMNPWPLIGGVAMRVVTRDEMVPQAGLLAPGDVLVLTKPLGNQVAVNLKQWLRRPSPLYETCIQGNVSEAQIDALYEAATCSMKRLNRTASRLMHAHGAHGATDVTGFGILGHAANFAAAQAEETQDELLPEGVQRELRQLCIVLDRLPIYATAVKASRLMKDKYGLLEGYSSETSGGLLVAFGSRQQAESYMRALEEADRAPAWLVGYVRARENAQGPYAILAGTCEILEV